MTNELKEIMEVLSFSEGLDYMAAIRTNNVSVVESLEQKAKERLLETSTLFFPSTTSHTCTCKSDCPNAQLGKCCSEL